MTAGPGRPRGARRLSLVVEIALVVALLAGAGAIRARVGRGWVFPGADGYNYMGAAAELVQHHRYAIRPPPWHVAPPQLPLGYCRLPGYPLLLAAFAPPGWTGSYEPMMDRAKPVQRVLDVLTCLIVFLLGRRLGGRAGGVIGLALCALNPTLALFSNSILTETLATLLTTLCVALLCGAALADTPRRRALLLGLAGAAAGASALVRLDGLVLFPCLLVPALVARRLEPEGAARPSRGARLLARLRPGLVAVAVAALCFAPWPLRNWARFGEPRLGGVCNLSGAAMTRTAFLAWFSTWVERESDTPETLYCFFRPGCVPWLGSFPKVAFDSPEERRTVFGLFIRMEHDGYSAAVDDGFRKLTRERVLRRPLRSLVVLPLRRAYHLWAEASDQPLRGPDTPWPEATRRVRPWLRALALAVAALGLLGVARLAAMPALRPVALVAAACVAIRTAFLALIGFVDNRYVLELTPLCLALGGAALGARLLAALGRRPRGSGPS